MFLQGIILNSNFSMIKRLFVWLALLPIFGCGQEEVVPVSNVFPSDQTEVVPNYIVQLNPDEPTLRGRRGTATEVLARAKALFTQLSPESSLVHIYANVCVGFSAYLTEADAAVLRRQREVLRVEANEKYSISQTSTVNRDSILPDSGTQEIPWGIALLRAPGIPSGKQAWILDTGIDLDHPDLRVDKAQSRSFLPWQYFEPDADDLGGHGTHVAGIIGALDNGRGVVGVAPGTSLVAVKVLSRRGVGVLSGILQGLEYVFAEAQPGDVANISFSGKASDVFDTAVGALAQKGIRVVIAAGNYSSDAADFSPSRTNGEGIYTVSALDALLRMADFSNYGTDVDFSEPGVEILSTYRDGRYAALSGTSAAAPHLAGLLLLKGAPQNLKIIGTATGDPDGIPDPVLGR